MNKRNLIGNYSISVLNMVLPIITLPILAKSLNQQSFGAYSVILTWLAFGAIAIDFGLSSFGTREISSDKHDKDDWFWSSFFIRAILCILVISLFSSGLIRTVNLTYAIRIAFAIALLGYVFQIFWASNGLQTTHLITPLFVGFRIMGTILVIGIANITHNLDATIIIFAFSLFIPNLYTFIAFTKVSALKKPERKNLSLISKVFNLGWSVASVSLMSIFFNGSLILVTQWYFGLSEAAGVSIADKVSRAILGLAAPFTISMLPFVTEGFRENHREGVQRIIRKGIWLLSFYIFSAAAAFIFSDTILKIFGSQFALYSTEMRILLIWSIFSLANNLIGIQYLIGSGLERVYSGIFASSCLLLIVLYAFLPKIFGLDGIIFSIFIGEVFFTVVSVFWIMLTFRRRQR